MRYQFWVSAGGALLLLGGSAVMGGWLLRFPSWEFISPTGTVMVFQTALCFALAGMGLAAAQVAPGQARHIRIAVGCAVTTISLLMLAEAIFSVDLGIDLTALHRWYPDNNPHPGRMAPNTAVAFLLGGVALVLGVTRNRTTPLSQAIPAVITTMGLIGLAGYTLLFDLAYSWYDVSRMAFSTAIGITVFGIGLFLDHRDTPAWLGTDTASAGSSEATDGRVYAFLGAAVTILAMIVFVSYGSIRALIDRATWVEHTGEIRTEFETMMALESRGHSAWQSFLVTGDPGEMFTAGAKMSGHVAHLQRLTASPEQQQRLGAMQQLIDANTTLLKQGNTGPKNGQSETQPETVATRQAVLRSNRQQFNSLAVAFRNEQDRLLAQRKQASRQSIATTIVVIFIGNLLGFAILFYAAWLLKRQNDLRDRLTAALQSSNAFLDSLVEHIPSMVFVKDAEHLRFVRLNRAGENLLGFPKADLIGKNDYDFFPHEEAEFFTARDRATLAGNAIVDIPEESIHTRFNGTRILHTRKIPIADEGGQPQYLLGISDDITERQRAEQKIVALNASLKARAGELEAANKELESFAYSVSHDLRAPLRAINGYALMLEEDYGDRLGGEAKRYIGQLRAYSAQMGALIDDLLRLSRLGRQELRMIEVDSNALLKEVLQAELGAWQGRAPRIEVADLPPVKADPLLLRQVWINLVSNALKYSSKNPAAVIEISGNEHDGEVVHQIRDNGAGFDMAYYDKLFSAFQRLHSADEFPGTGIGLAIVHRIVTRHGGRVWAKGELDHGAEFFFALPNPKVHAVDTGI